MTSAFADEYTIEGASGSQSLVSYSIVEHAEDVVGEVASTNYVRNRGELWLASKFVSICQGYRMYSVDQAVLVLIQRPFAMAVTAQG